jgi:SAM-dependent methyltransferase
MSTSKPAPPAERQLDDTRRAFDGVAAEYDGPLGNNGIIQRLRARFWRVLLATFPRGARLLDLGCGTGLDAVYLAQRGYEVVASDWSERMVERTRARAHQAGVAGRLRAEVVGIHELDRLRGDRFAGLYSNLGPFNCVPDLASSARACADLLAPGGHLVATVIGCTCPWEMAYYRLRGDLSRANLRQTSEAVPVGLRGETIWTRYYTPREFSGAFAEHFSVTHYRALCWLLPPPYLDGVYARLGSLGEAIDWLDDRLGALPGIRDVGDHFLLVLTRRA